MLLFFSSVLYTKFVSRRREASRGRAEQGRADEELTITPIATPLVTAPPPYENPPPFEDATKRTQIASTTPNQATRREEGGERDEVAG